MIGTIDDKCNRQVTNNQDHGETARNLRMIIFMLTREIKWKPMSTLMINEPLKEESEDCCVAMLHQVHWRNLGRTMIVLVRMCCVVVMTEFNEIDR